MEISIEHMSEQIAKKILGWKYEQPYDFYNNELTDESIKELLDGFYYALVIDKQTLLGFFCIGESAQVPVGNQFGVYSDDCVDIGLGMNPKLVGQGNGFEFCSFILSHIENNHSGIPIRLTVAKFNERAIHLYEKLGFVRKNEFTTDFSGFIVMVK
ncbi:N-acetyltransferase [Psychrobacillus glaciei]|uniref:N-acetyltransferase n=1 Tax=Psychrobacillus glaciei TaxID=2283160 RepID=A0A5J6SMN3_9BACI|nr:GNAT family protein [Psychrobacillus glaciei]QFF99176.1 N-acetyltransferase [Psychrobacillus glaciei]